MKRLTLVTVGLGLAAAMQVVAQQKSVELRKFLAGSPVVAPKTWNHIRLVRRGDGAWQ